MYVSKAAYCLLALLTTSITVNAVPTLLARQDEDEGSTCSFTLARKSISWQVHIEPQIGQDQELCVTDYVAAIKAEGCTVSALTCLFSEEAGYNMIFTTDRACTAGQVEDAIAVTTSPSLDVVCSA